MTNINPFQPYQTYIVILLLFLVLIFIFARLSPKQKDIAYITKSQTDEILDTFDWLMKNQIITATEYNQLIVKSQPFLK